MDKYFITSIKNNDYELFKKCKKTNLHTHAVLSANRQMFYQEYHKQINRFETSNNIESLSKFIKDNIVDITSTLEGQLKLFELTTLTAIDNGVSILDTSVDYRLVKDHYNYDYKKYIKDLKTIKDKYSDLITINFDLGISRNAYTVEDKKIIIDLIKEDFFHGIDLYGNELSKNIKSFKKIYHIARKHNMILKAHVGEFGDAKSILYAVKVLKLNVIQHGITVVNNKRIMKKLKKRKIVFNVCPISNIKLMRVTSIKKHPVREMFDNGLIITINTDDELIFENSLFDEYQLLYKSKVFTAEELNQIRQNALDIFSN